jgi:hypothetical protein
MKQRYGSALRAPSKMAATTWNYNCSSDDNSDTRSKSKGSVSKLMDGIATHFVTSRSALSPQLASPLPNALSPKEIIQKRQTTKNTAHRCATRRVAEVVAPLDATRIPWY